MSLELEASRLLSEALKEAMDRDLAAIPPADEIERGHRFSKRFIRGMKRIEAGRVNGMEGVADARAHSRRRRRIEGIAAAIACVVLASVAANVIGVRMESSMGDAGSSPSSGDVAQDADQAQEDGSSDGADAGFAVAGNADSADAGAESESAGNADAGGGMAAEEDGAVSGGDAGMESGGQETDADADAGMEYKEDASGRDQRLPMAPDWQEHLLDESAMADQIAAWTFVADYGDGTISLRTVVDVNRSIRISGIFEVYYEQAEDDWTLVYRDSGVEQPDYAGPCALEDNVTLAELGMTRPGSYRIVRRVNQYRQVLQLSLEEK